jgi:putative ABC transport system substrate-binding protein
MSDMKRREFITLLGGAAAWPFAARAQQQTRVPRLGWLVTGSPTSHRFSLAAFRDGLKELAYVEGQNISIEFRWAEGDVARISELAKNLVDLKVDVILAGGTVVAQAAKRATSHIPIVAAGRPRTACDTARSRRRDGRMMRREFITLIGGAPAWPLVARAQQSSSAVIGFLSTLTPEGFSEPMRGFRQGLRESGCIEAENLRIEYRWAENQMDRLPTLAADLVKRIEVGGLMSYGTNLTEAYRQMGAYAGRVLRGTQPADLPVVRASKFELVINAQTARLLRLTIPPTLLATADEVIERDAAQRACSNIDWLSREGQRNISG